MLHSKFQSAYFLDSIPTNWTLINEQPSVNYAGWDTIKASYIMTAAARPSAEAASAFFSAGRQLDIGRHFYLVSFNGPVCLAEGIYKVDATYQGIAADHPVTIRYGASAQQQTVEGVFIVGVGEVDHANVFENVPTATVRYILTDYTTAPMQEIGRNHTPPAAVALPNAPASFWVTLENYTVNYPSGWVLMGVTTDPIPGTTLAYVEESYQYNHAIVPR